MPEMTYAQAVNSALDACLSEHPEVILFGEDVAIPGGVFGVTKGLHKKYGDRVFDTPISESAMLGAAVGASMFGRRPIVEIMWLDFMLVALDQVVNQAANTRYVSRGRLSSPLTIRTQAGSAPGACAQHSQNLEAMLAHVPGLVVGMPSSPQDAYDMTRAAVASDDPTIVIENRTLYHAIRADIGTDGPIQGTRGARTARAGRDATVVAWGDAVHKVQESATRLAADGVELEVIDPRWLRPFDIDAVIESVERTGSLCVVHDAHTYAGLGAEVVAAVTERGIPMRRPPLRIGAKEARIPAAPALLAQVLPTVDLITARCRDWLGDVAR